MGHGNGVIEMKWIHRIDCFAQVTTIEHEGF